MSDLLSDLFPDIAPIWICLAYLTIGVMMGVLSITTWGRYKRSLLSCLLFPWSTWKNTVGSNGDTFVHELNELGEYFIFFVCHILLWPIKVVWNTVTIAILAINCLFHLPDTIVTAIRTGMSKREAQKQAEAYNKTERERQAEELRLKSPLYRIQVLTKRIADDRQALAQAVEEFRAAKNEGLTELQKAEETLMVTETIEELSKTLS